MNDCEKKIELLAVSLAACTRCFKVHENDIKRITSAVSDLILVIEKQQDQIESLQGQVKQLEDDKKRKYEFSSN